MRKIRIISRFTILISLVSLLLTLPVMPIQTSSYKSERNGEDYLRYYNYDKSMPLNATMTLIEDGNGYKVFKVYFNSINNERVPAILILPEGEGPFPCIVFLHGYGGKKENILSAVSLASREGYALISIDAEYHGERREEGKALYSTNLTDSRRAIIQTVVDLRRAVDYLETRPEIDEDKIGYVGGSMGGILGAIFIGVEPRIKAAVLLVAGGNMSLMIMKSEHPAIPPIREYIKEANISYSWLQKFMDPVDPLNFIWRFSPRPVVFHLGKYDNIVPAQAGELLYQKAGEPKQVYWYDTGHDLPLDLVIARTLDFLDRELKGKTFTFHETEYWLLKYGLPVGGAIVIAAIAILFIKKIFRRLR